MKKAALIAMAFIWTIVAQGQNTDTTGYQSFFGQESTEWWGMIGYPDYYKYRVIRTTYDEGEGMSEEVLIVDMSLSLEDTIILGGFFTMG